MPTTPKILCVSANPAIDRRITLRELRLGEVNRAAEAIPAAGGKAAHVAFAAKRLGAEVRWMAFLGGPEGDLCREGVAQHGITPVVVPIRQSTRTNLELIEQNGGRVTEVLEPGPTIDALEAEHFLAEFRDQLSDRPSVVISGSLPAGIPMDFYAALIAVARERGCRVALDTSGEALVKGVGATPNLIKPNRQEAGALLREELRSAEDAAKAARRIQEKGVETVIVSLGHDGALVASQQGVLHGIPPEVAVRSTVGSGDSFLAGWTVAEAQGRSTTDCLRLAVACGTANCVAESPAHIDVQLVNGYLPQIRITQL